MPPFFFPVYSFTMTDTPTSIVIGTRGSQLATTQTGMVRDSLTEHWQSAVDVRLEIVRTRGDIDRQSLREIGGQGIFTREIERELLAATVDLAVHSLKDLPTQMDADLQLVAIPEREDVRDVLVTTDGVPLADLPDGARVGTGSARRQAQLALQRPDLVFVDLRGNVDTRLRKVHDGQAEAVVLAAAGMRRLGLQDQISEYLDPLTVLPAPGQGALGLQMRSADTQRHPFVAVVDHAPTHAAITAERAFLAGLGGGCRAPIAAWARWEQDRLVVDGFVSRDDGSDAVRVSAQGSAEEAETLGQQLADDVRATGADSLLADIDG